MDFDSINLSSTLSKTFYLNRYGPMVRILAFHVSGRGSIPCIGVFNLIGDYSIMIIA